MNNRSHKEKNILAKLAAENFKVTKKRVLIIHEFCQQDTITDVASIYTLLRQKYRISYSTVYVCLALLVKLNILFVDSDNSKNVYKFNTDV